MTKIFFLPLSKIFGSCKLSRSIDIFSKLLAKDSIFPEFITKVKVLTTLGFDSAYYHTIENYKKGLITTEDFRAKLLHQLGINASDQDFDNAWNAMCEFKDENIAKAKMFLKTHEYIPFTLYIVSYSNPLQIDFINQQLKEKVLPNSNLNNNKIHYINSFDKNTGNFLELIKTTIAEDNLNIESNQLYFFNINNINLKDNNYLHARAELIEANIEELLDCAGKCSSSSSTSDNCEIYVN